MFSGSINNKKKKKSTLKFYSYKYFQVPSDSPGKCFPVFCWKTWMTFSSGFNHSSISFNPTGVYTLARDPSAMTV